MTVLGAHECAPYEILLGRHLWRPGQSPHYVHGDMVNHRTLSILMRFPLRNADARL